MIFLALDGHLVGLNIIVDSFRLWPIGNGIFDPNCLQGSGGLIQMQLILATNKKQGYAQIEIDQIKLTKDVIQNKQEENELYYDEAGF